MTNIETETKKVNYQHMNINTLENMIKILDYADCNEDKQKVIKLYSKKIKRHYNPKMDRKSKTKMLSKYNMRGMK